ncbi:hypothetical protein BDZ45DRAFT_691471 [Acephala macrosclerotiorum]|nr:hypothetical protein BDZ45DRAFT_691471 [Acephala macrosclerotiorum]
MSSQSTEGSGRRPNTQDISHHFSKASKKRAPNVLKEYYKFLRIPKMGNPAGGPRLKLSLRLPFPGNCPFDTLEISLVEANKLSTLGGEDTDLDHASSSTQHVKIPRSPQSQNITINIDLDTALQYGSAQGYPPLYAWLEKLTNTGADIMINCGSADDLSKIYELLFNPCDKDTNDVRDREGLIVEEFIYAHALVLLRPKDLNILPVKTNGEGMLAHSADSLLDVL